MLRELRHCIMENIRWRYKTVLWFGPNNLFIKQEKTTVNFKYIFILLLLFCAFTGNTNAQVFYKSGTFKIANASKRSMYPGVQGSPISTTTSFTLIVKKCTRFSIDSFWQDGYTDQVSVGYKNGSIWDGKPMAGDTLLVSCTYYRSTSDNRPGMPMFFGSITESPKIKHKGLLLFRYFINGKPYFFSIKNMEVLESVYAP